MNTKKLSQWVIVLIVAMLLLAGCGEKAPAQPADPPLPPATPIAAKVFEDALQKNGFGLYPENQENCTAACESFQNFNNYNMGADVYENGALNLAWTLGFGVDPIKQTDMAEKIISAIYPQDVASGILSAIKANASSVGSAGNYNWNIHVSPSVMLTVYIAPNSSTTTTADPFKCNITTKSYGFEIGGESGQVATTMHDEKTSYQYAPSGERSGMTVDVNRELTFADSKNTYKIAGKIVLDLANNSVSYDITATGGAFGDTPQTCKK